MTLQGLRRLHFTTVNTFTLEMKNSNPLAILFGSLFIYQMKWCWQVYINIKGITLQLLDILVMFLMKSNEILLKCMYVFM